MAQEDVVVQELSTARGNAMTVVVDLVSGRARVVEQDRRSREAMSQETPTASGLRFQTTSAA